MLVAASTECFPGLPLADCIERLVDLEFTNIEIALHENGGQLKPSQIAADVDRAVDVCRKTRRLCVVCYSVDIDAPADQYYQQFRACCRLAKATKAFTLTIPSCELGTPFNEEVERLRKLVSIGAADGVLVAVKSQVGCLTQDPSTVQVLCDNVANLGLTLDPSHYIAGPHAGGSIDQIMKYVYHVHLRDSTKDKLQVRVGQGEVEYARLLTQLRRVGYDRTLSVNIQEMPDVDHFGELRKMRLLLESML